MGTILAHLGPCEIPTVDVNIGADLKVKEVNL